MKLLSVFVLLYAGLAIAQGQNPDKTTAVGQNPDKTTAEAPLEAQPTAAPSIQPVVEGNPSQTTPAPPQETPADKVNGGGNVNLNAGQNALVIENAQPTPTPTPANQINLNDPQLQGQNVNNPHQETATVEITVVTTAPVVVVETAAVDPKAIETPAVVPVGVTDIGNGNNGNNTPKKDPEIDLAPTPVDNKPVPVVQTPVVQVPETNGNDNNAPKNGPEVVVSPAPAPVENKPVPVVETPAAQLPVNINGNENNGNNAPKKDPEVVVSPAPAPVENKPVPETPVEATVPATNNNNVNGNVPRENPSGPPAVPGAVENVVPKTNNGNVDVPAKQDALPAPTTTPAVPTVSDVLNGNAAPLVPAPASSPTAENPTESRPPVVLPSSLPVSNAPPARPAPNSNNILLNSGPGGSQNSQEETVARVQPNTDIFQTTRPGQTSGGSFAIGSDIIPSNILPASTPEGQRLLNLLPSLRGYSYNNLRGLPSGVPMVVLSLKLPCGDACNPAPDSQRLKFESTIIADIIAALGNDKLTNDKIVALNVLDVNGRTAVQLAFLPLSDGTSPFLVVQQLHAQLMDSKSKLLTSGVLSPTLDFTVFGSDIIMPLSNDTAVDSSSKTQTIVIICVSIVLYLGLMGIFYVGFRQYKARIKQEEIDRQNSFKETVWEYKELKLDPSKRRQEYDSIIIVDIADDDDDDDDENDHGDERPVSYVTYRSSEVKSTSSVTYDSFPRGASARQSGFDPSQYHEMREEV